MPKPVSPKITQQPQSQSVLIGNFATFKVAAVGTQPLEYQWYKDGKQIAGATEVTLSFASVSKGDLGIYSVKVQNIEGKVTSQTVKLSSPVHALTVASRDPDSEVTVTVSPADNNGQADGATQFTRVYPKGTEVTLTANSTSGSNQFKQWLKNGEPAGTEPTVTVTMDYDRTLRAVYEPKPVTLTVASRDPDSGVTVTVSPADKNGQADGTTPFTHTYDWGTKATLTAEQSAGSNWFKQWLKNGEQVGTEPTVNVTMRGDQSLRAVYVPPHTLTVHTLTVVSRNPDDGVTVIVSPADTEGESSGTTHFTLEYPKGAKVTLTAERAAGGNRFKQWLKNEEAVSTEPMVTVTVDGDYTLRALYEPGPVGCNLRRLSPSPLAPCLPLPHSSTTA
jgi:hypothetical protein